MDRNIYVGKFDTARLTRKNCLSNYQFDHFESLPDGSTWWQRLYLDNQNRQTLALGMIHQMNEPSNFQYIYLLFKASKIK